MIPRSMRMPTLLAVSVAAPYVASNAPDWAKQVQQQVQLPSQSASAQQSTAPSLFPAGSAGAFTSAPQYTPPELRPLPQLAPPKAPGSEILPVTTPLEGYPTYSVNDVFRLDVTKEWVYQRWPRKSTAVGALDLFGVRVPLVTGPQYSDLAGALTYYFGPTGRVERISFRGRTGDTTQIVMLATQRFGLTAQPTSNSAEQLFQYRRDADVICQLRTTPAPVLWESSPHDSFSVELDIQQLDTGRPLAPDALPSSLTKSAAPASPAAGSNATPATPPAATESAAKEDRWGAFFPRSRVPENQLDDLNRPRELW